MRSEAWSRSVKPGSPLKVTLDGDAKHLELHAVALRSGEQAVLMCKSGGDGLSLRVRQVTTQQPCCKVRLRAEEDMEFSVSGGEVVLTGLLATGVGRKRAQTSKEDVAEPVKKVAKVEASPKPEAKLTGKQEATKVEVKAEAKAAPKPVVDPRVPLRGMDDQAAIAFLAGAKAAKQVAKQPLPKQDTKAAAPGPKKFTLKGGLTYELLKAGKGPSCSPGRKVTVKYDGRLAKNGKRFDRGRITFKLGAGEVIQGWDEGVKGMLRGEQRRLLIPAKMGYGAMGAPPDIPRNADLTFEVELLQF